MNDILKDLTAELQALFGGSIQSVDEFRDDVIVTLDKNAIVEVTTWLRDNPKCPFPLCEDVFGIDMYERTNRFHVNYHFLCLQHNVRIHLKVKVDEMDLRVPTITGVHPSADWNERETYDMYGIVFTGHPDLRRAYMPEDYEYYPLRKDFPLMGIPGSIPLPKR